MNKTGQELKTIIQRFCISIWNRMQYESQDAQIRNLMVDGKDPKIMS